MANGSTTIRPCLWLPGVVRVVLGVRAFGEHVPPAFVPRVECFAPSDGGFGIVDAGERVGEFLELPAGLQSGSGGQIGPCVALRAPDIVGPACAARFARAT